MTEYTTSDGKKVIAWRIPGAINCPDKCPHYGWTEDGKIAFTSLCEHPQAGGKRGGWLKKCPLKKEVERGGEA